MKITESRIKIQQLVEGYQDKEDDGVYGYWNDSHKLTIRPPFQREFVYNEKQRDAVIDTVLKGFPLNTMYWSKVSDYDYEVLDGQQRTLSISQFYNGDYPVSIDGNFKFYHNLTEQEKQDFLNYELMVFVCDGSESEKYEWFKTINVAGEPFTNQELLNVCYVGTWLSDAKAYFSKRGCVAVNLSDGYMRGKSLRQDYLAGALKWVAHRDKLSLGQNYMEIHQHDENADDLWGYFTATIEWAKSLFPTPIKNITDLQEWGILYNLYHDNQYDPEYLNSEISRLVLDDDVTRKHGIIPYLLSNKTDEAALAIRDFTDSQKKKAYEKQERKCAICGNLLVPGEYFSQMIIPWRDGGQVNIDNLRLVCMNDHDENETATTEDLIVPETEE